MRDLYYLSCVILLCGVNGRVVNSTEAPQVHGNVSSTPPGIKPGSPSGVRGARRRRFISQGDMVSILDYHNQVRARVYPPAANMEYMVREDTGEIGLSSSSYLTLVCSYRPKI